MNFQKHFYGIHEPCFRYYALCLMLIIFQYQPAFSQQDFSADTSKIPTFKTTLQKLITDAQNNPRLKAADAKVQASSASVNIKKSLAPPQVGLEFYQTPLASFPNPFRNQMEYDYSIQQMIPFPGKRDAMTGAERKLTKMLIADRQTQEHDIVRNVKSIFFELYLKDRQIEINHETHVLMREFVEIAQKQYQVGMGKQSDVLRARTELSSLGNDSIVLVQQRKSIEGMLNALCNRPVSAVIDFIPEINPPVIPNYELTALMAIAEKNRPELVSMQTGIEMQQAERAITQKGLLPDFMLRGTYKQMKKADDDWSLMIGATIPVAPWASGRYSSGTARADANIQGAQSELANMKNMIASEVNDAILKLQSAGDRIKLSRATIIPQAQETLESALSAYRTGKQEFLMIIDIQRMLLMARLDYHTAVMALLDSQSLLERAAGLNIDEIDKSFERGKR